MTTQSLPVSTLVDITTAIAGGGAMRLAFGRGLLITTDEAIIRWWFREGATVRQHQ